MSHKTLFLQQSYADSTEQYFKLLHAPNLPLWDYIILTASNESQARAYQMQIKHRLDKGMLPSSTHYAVLSDPEGKRVGSGGATLNVLKYIRKHEDSFEDLRVLVIHSGGDSKRVPQYSACGKLFSPVPRLLPNGQRSTLFDEFMVSMSGVASRMNAGMLVCSGDVLLLFNPLQIDFYGKGAAAISMKEPIEIGKSHGVYCIDERGNVGSFLHKKTMEQLHKMNAVDEYNNVDIDTGAVIMDSSMLDSLYSLIDTEEKFKTYVNEEVRLSFYADFLYPLASDSTLEDYYKETPEGEFTQALSSCRTALWEILRPYRMKLIRVSPAAFIHFGTTKELLYLMTEGMEQFKYLGWKSNINTNSRKESHSSSNSYIGTDVKVGRGSYIEDSHLSDGTQVGENCIISGVRLQGQTIPDGTVLHGLKLEDGNFVVRMYSVNDNPKENTLFGKEIGEPLWTASIYPIRSTMNEAINATLEAYENGFVFHDTNSSLKDSFNRADVASTLPWQERLSNEIKMESFLDSIDRKEDLQESISIFAGELSDDVKHKLLDEANKMDSSILEQFSRKIRIYYALSYWDTDYRDDCFTSISQSILSSAIEDLHYDEENVLMKDEVKIELPVRVNWGGGWSDTPPYCMENGGTVLNAAVRLEGRFPVEAVARKIKEHKILFASADSGAEQSFFEIKELQDSSNPYDPFALHKAALIACGIIPYDKDVSVEEITKKLGGGLYLSTQVINIPRGSGLGTSSILAGACVKAIYGILGKEISEGELYNRVLCIEQLMSTGGGWQDQVGGLAPGIKMVTSDSSLQQKISCIPCSISQETMKELDERFCLIYSGQRRLARNLLRDVVGRYITGNQEAVEVLYEIQRLAVLMRFELEKGNIDGFAKLLTEHWELSKRLDGGCTNICIDMIFSSIEDLIDGKMICGAGGGGFLQVIMRKDVTVEQLRKRLKDVFRDSGVDVWKCTFA